jgi:ATP-dependent DNA helicase RecG
VSYKIETLQRKNVLELPEDALREAVVNAVCHRDYFEKGARVMVEIYDNRVDIISPGGVCKGITHENFGTVSITRNSVLASMLYRIGYIEQMGMGIIRMKNAAMEANVAEPEFELSGFFKVTFKRNEADISIACQSITNQPQSISPADRKKAILSFLEEHNRVKVQDLTKIIDLSDSRIRTMLRDMANEGTIEKVGRNRYAYYILKKDRKRAVISFLEEHGQAKV